MASILIVDDDGMFRELLRIQLSAVGYTVTEAEDASDAIHALLQQDFDLVITDVAMPYMDGVELTRAIAGDPKTRHIPVMVLSGLDEDAILDRARLVGACEVLSKPLQAEEILRTVEKIIQTRKQFKQKLSPSAV